MTEQQVEVEHDHEKCCRYLRCAHPKCCGYYGQPAPQAEMADRTTCGAGSDGDCYADGCVQARDGEPAATGRFCPLPIGNPLLALRESDDPRYSPESVEGGPR